jgi:hypothetical protein
MARLYHACDSPVEALSPDAHGLFTEEMTLVMLDSGIDHAGYGATMVTVQTGVVVD